MPSLHDERSQLVNAGLHASQQCISITGLDDLRNEITGFNLETPINQLCRREENDVIFISMVSAKPIDKTARQFDIMYREYSTDIFFSIWKSKVKAARSQRAAKLAIEDIKLIMWGPTVDEGRSLLESLQDRSIKLTEVDRYFSEIKDLESQLHRFHGGIMRCLGSTEQVKSFKWLKTAVKLIEEYWSLLRLADAADVIIDIKNSLTLSGDFTLIQSIAEKVMSIA